MIIRCSFCAFPATHKVEDEQGACFFCHICIEKSSVKHKSIPVEQDVN